MTGSRRPPLAVTFDFWDTLVHAPRPADVRERRREGVRQVLARAGTTVTDDELDRALDEVRRTFDQHWEANRQFDAASAVDLLLDRFGHPGDADLHAAALAAFLGDGSAAVPALTPNVVTALDGLADRGVRVGIICDVGFAPSPVLRGYLEHHGVLDRFDHWSFSDEVGVYKPDRAIFEHALAGLGTPDPADAAHVGDLRRTDVAGALAMGMTAVRYTGSNDDDDADGDRAMAGDADASVALPEADHVVADHADLLAVLGF